MKKKFFVDFERRMKKQERERKERRGEKRGGGSLVCKKSDPVSFALSLFARTSVKENKNT